MVVMALGDLLTEVSIFLRVTLAKEKLSENAECCRQRLIQRLIMRESSPPQAYIDMTINGSSQCCQKVQHQNSDSYEVLNNSCEENYKSKELIADGFVNSLCNDLSLLNESNIYANDQDRENFTNLKHSNFIEENAYTQPTSPLANTPVTLTKPSVPVKNPPSNPNSERNSIISIKKDSPDRCSDSSSFSSSSTRCDESPEVSSISASALRYAASKSGLLGHREKFLFMDHTKQYWAALLNQTLFMFTTDKDLKPVCELDISGYKARPVTISSSNKLDFKFELVSPGKKTHQFIAEKYTDMDTWIIALNTANKPIDTAKEWVRELPSLPLNQDIYDHPDCAVRPLIEAEYELPDTILRRSSLPSPTNNLLSFTQHKDRAFTNEFPSAKYVTNNNIDRRSNGQMKSGKAAYSPKECRRLPSLPHEQETYDQPESGIRPVLGAQQEVYENVQDELYHCIDDQPQKPKDTKRRLPLLPHEKETFEETYDQPEPTNRPVNAKLDIVVQEEFYSVIDTVDNTEKTNTQNGLYKNLEANDGFRNQDNEGNYYNVGTYPERETDQECIYDVITEQRQLKAPSPSPNKQVSPANTMKPMFSVNSCINSALTEEIKLKLEGRKLGPVVSNMTTFFNKPFVKPQIKVKPPVINKSCQ